MDEQSRELRMWTRWQDWATLVIGIACLCGPLFVHLVPYSDPKATITTLGIVLAFTSLASLGAPQSVSVEWIHVVIGALLAAAPWLVGYAADAGAAWLSWIAGGLTVAIAVTAMRPARLAHRIDLASRLLGPRPHPPWW